MAVPFVHGSSKLMTERRYMDLDTYETAFFNEQITLAVASLGFEQPDIDYTNTSLATVFGHRCSPPTVAVPPSAGERLQSICVAPDCPLDTSPDCAAYPNDGVVPQPEVANATLAGNVTKIDETKSATTALWPSHCETIAARDEDSASVVCSGTASSVPGAATANASSAAAAGYLRSKKASLLWVVECIVVAVGVSVLTLAIS